MEPLLSNWSANWPPNRRARSTCFASIARCWPRPRLGDAPDAPDRRPPGREDQRQTQLTAAVRSAMVTAAGRRMPLRRLRAGPARRRRRRSIRARRGSSLPLAPRAPGRGLVSANDDRAGDGLCCPRDLGPSRGAQLPGPKLRLARSGLTGQPADDAPARLRDLAAGRRPGPPANGNRHQPRTAPSGTRGAPTDAEAAAGTGGEGNCDRGRRCAGPAARPAPRGACAGSGNGDRIGSRNGSGADGADAGPLPRPAAPRRVARAPGGGRG